jgi:hypothetical protein
MTTQNYYLYIGADNTTGIVGKDDIIQVLSRRFDGFTLQDTVGYWKGKPEQSCMVTLANIADGNVVQETARELAEILKQDAVGVVAMPTNMAFITPATL